MPTSHRITAEDDSMEPEVATTASTDGPKLMGAGADHGESEVQDLKVLLAEKKFLLRSAKTSSAEKETLRKEVESAIFEHNLAPMYQHLCGVLGWPVDDARLETMTKANAAKLEELDAKIKDCEDNTGDVEVRDALMAKADFLVNIGDKAAAWEAYAEVQKKTAVANICLTIVFSKIRLEMFYGEWSSIKELIATAKQLCESGGDWEKKNRLMIYEAVFCLAQRDFKRASALFQESVATFTTYELFPYERCIFYAVVTSIVSLTRVQLKAKVVEAPEVLTVIHKIPGVQTFLNSLYHCKYEAFFPAFLEVVAQCNRDLLLHAHVRYYMREVRVVAYSQFLESYKSVTISAMAARFGVSPEFMDSEISTFIVEGRLPAKIDKVANVIETTRSDARHNLYQQCIKQGDVLLNRIQKLSKIVDVE